MALTFTEVQRIRPAKGVRFAIMDITFDSSYATGGWAIAASDVKMSRIITIGVMGGPQVAAAGATLGWDPVNSKLLAFKGAAGMLPEIAAADLNGRVFRVFVIGA